MIAVSVERPEESAVSSSRRALPGNTRRCRRLIGQEDIDARGLFAASLQIELAACAPPRPASGLCREVGTMAFAACLRA